MLRPGIRTSSVFNSQHVATLRNFRGQTRATSCAQKRWDMLRGNLAIVWPEFAKAGPTLLGYIALRFCYRLAGALKIVPEWMPKRNIVGRTCPNDDNNMEHPTCRSMSQHVATGGPNARNLLCPTMLRYAALKSLDRLAGA